MTAARSGPPLGGYADLARAFRRGRDYDIVVRRRPGARVAVIAPHGGRIENGTSEIARGLAADDFHLYLFEGPECLSLIATSPVVVAVHGCSGEGEQAYLGGLDVPVRDRLAAALRAAGVPALTENHPFPAVRAANVCNRGASGRGVQLELTHALRDGTAPQRVVEALRPALLELRGG